MLGDSAILGAQAAIINDIYDPSADRCERIACPEKPATLAGKAIACYQSAGKLRADR
jgi:hypothetical protein